MAVRWLSVSTVGRRYLSTPERYSENFPRALTTRRAFSSESLKCQRALTQKNTQCGSKSEWCFCPTPDKGKPSARSSNRNCYVARCVIALDAFLINTCCSDVAKRSYRMFGAASQSADQSFCSVLNGNARCHEQTKRALGDHAECAKFHGFQTEDGQWLCGGCRSRLWGGDTCRHLKDIQKTSQGRSLQGAPSQASH